MRAQGRSCAGSGRRGAARQSLRIERPLGSLQQTTHTHTVGGVRRISATKWRLQTDKKETTKSNDNKNQSCFRSKLAFKFRSPFFFIARLFLFCDCRLWLIKINKRNLYLWPEGLFNGSLSKEDFPLGFHIVSMYTSCNSCPVYIATQNLKSFLQSISYHCLSCARTFPVTPVTDANVFRPQEVTKETCRSKGLGWESNRQPFCSRLFRCSFHIVNMFWCQRWSEGSLSAGKYLVCRPCVHWQIHQVAELGWEFELVGKQHKIHGFQFPLSPWY